MAKISDLFTLEYGHSLELNRLEPSSDPDAINFVGRAARNNGVTARVKPIQGLSPSPAGTITVALNGQGGAGVAFLQPFPFYSGFHIMLLTPKRPMSEQEKLWWVMCITANRFRFGFGRQANRTLKYLTLPPPSNLPAWVKTTSADSYEGAKEPSSKKIISLGDKAKWKAFALQDLFEIRKGQRLTKADMIPGETPFIGSTDSNNGITARVGQSPIHEGNTISVAYNGSVAETFYQPVPYWATDDVNVLYPRFKMTPAIGLFIATLIRRERYRFNYGRKWHMDRMNASTIRLPVTTSGSPDYGFMDGFIKALPYSSQIEG